MNALGDLRSLLTNEVQHGDFTLASGAKSTWYLDCRPVTFGYPEIVAEAIMDALAAREDFLRSDIRNLNLSVGGPAVGAVPIATALAIRLHARSWAVRKAEKEHGADKSLVIGALRDADHYITVDDVWTTGGSVLRAAGAARERGAFPIVVVTLLYRGDPNEDYVKPPKIVTVGKGLEAYDVPYIGLLTPDDIGVTS